MHTRRTARLINSDGQAIEIPACALHALELAVEVIARGQTVILVTHGSELTTQEAADLLHVSRPHLVNLLDDGVIDHYRVASHLQRANPRRGRPQTSSPTAAPTHREPRA